MARRSPSGVTCAFRACAWVGWLAGLGGCLEAAGANRQEDIGAAPAALGSDHLELFSNAAGKAATYSTVGAIDTGSAFFQSLGGNGRACVTCHVPSDGFTITPATVQSLFERCEEGGRPPRAK